MSKNVIHDINIIIENNPDSKDSEQLSKDFLEQIALVIKEASEQNDTEQLMQEQQTNTATAENTSTPAGEGAIASSKGQSATPSTAKSTTSSASGETTTTFSAPTGGGVTDNSEQEAMNLSASADTTPSVSEAENGETDSFSGTTAETYAGVDTQQSIAVPKALQGKTNEPSMETLKEKVIDEISKAVKNNDESVIDYWRGILKALENGATAKDFYRKKDHERFTKMYFGLQKWRLATDEDLKNSPSIYNVNWGEASEKMISKLRELAINDPEIGDYYKKLIYKIKDSNVDISKLFEEHDELFLLLKTIFPSLPERITVITRKRIYPDLSPKKVYPNLGAECIYSIWSGTLIDEVVVKYGIGEKTIGKNGRYPELKHGHWYDYDRINNPIKAGSTFWNASIYNTKKGNDYLYNTIEQRQAYYLFADAYLKTKGIISEWFDAAARVTMGSIKDSLQGETALGAAEQLNLWYLSNDTEEFLKQGNKYLFSDNMKNVKLLLEGKGKLSGEFIDAKGKKQSFKGLTKQELDLKLVEFEQSLVQEYINSSFNDLNNSFMKKSLDEVAYTSGNKEYDAIVKQVNENFSHWMAPDIIQEIMEEHFMEKKKLTFNFAKYEDRVKLGQIMVKKLYYLKLSDTFKVDNIDKILKNPKDFSQKTIFFKINQENAVREKTKYLKEYKIASRLENIKNNFNKKHTYILSNLDKVGEVLSDVKDAIIEELLKSAGEIKEDFENDLNELYDEIATEFNKIKKGKHYDKEYSDKVEQLYNEIKDIVEKRNELLERIKKISKNKAIKLKNQVIEEVTQIPNEIAGDVLVKTAERIYPGVGKLNDKGKENLFKKNYEASVAILLYEFATGTGPEARNFDYHKHAFARAILHGRMINEIMEETLKLLRQTRYDFVNKPDSKELKIDLEFSPTPTYAIESLDKHLDSNFAQIFIGGAFALVRIRNGKLEGYIYNQTSRESLGLHLEIGNIKRKKNGKKETAISTVVQRFYFTFKLP
ncbi:hypothetical protein ABGT15_04765 [Flavobacterium enshiense]|uniref:hypothetical protein n=1 Tax=Flavobacterium enshiense TaxID=1341165 RepID=UPI00345CC37F